MKILGVDLDSTKFGLTLFEDENFVASFFKQSSEKTSQERIYELYCMLDEMLEKLQPDKVYIEKTFKTSNVLSESVGNFKLLCRLHGIQVETVHNKIWKKAVIGNGNCSKEDIKNFVEKIQPGLVGSKQDVFDSYGIGLYGVRNEYSTKV